MKAGNHLLDKFKPLQDYICPEVRQPGHVPPWACETLDKLTAERVRNENENHGDRSGGMECVRRSLRPDRHQDIDIKSYEFRDHAPEVLRTFIWKPMFEGDVLAIHVTESTKAFDE